MRTFSQQAPKLQFCIMSLKIIVSKYIATYPRPNDSITHHLFYKNSLYLPEFVNTCTFLHHVFCNMLTFCGTDVWPISSTGALSPLCPAKSMFLVSLHSPVYCLVRRASVDCPNNIYYSLIYLTWCKVESQMKPMCQQWNFPSRNDLKCQSCSEKWSEVCPIQ